MVWRFRDRRDAGRQLAEKLRPYAQHENRLVLALPRGGVPVAVEVAQALQAPLDVIVVRKLGVPGQEELAMGALAMGGVRVLNPAVVQTLDIPEHLLQAATERETRELQRRERAFRGDRPFPPVEQHTVFLIDDGLATGSTMKAAVEIVAKHQPRRLIVAVPVAPPSTLDMFRDLADDVVAIQAPEPFYAIGLWYDDFRQLDDDDVRQLLAQVWGREAAGKRG